MGGAVAVFVWWNSRQEIPCVPLCAQNFCFVKGTWVLLTPLWAAHPLQMLKFVWPGLSCSPGYHILCCLRLPRPLP